MGLFIRILNWLFNQNANNLRTSCAFWLSSVLSHFCFNNRHKVDTLHTSHTNYMHNNLSPRLMGISAMKTIFRNVEISWRNWWKPLEKQELRITFLVNILEQIQLVLKTNFCDRLIFSLKIEFNSRKFLLNSIFKLTSFFCVLFQRFFVDFSVSFQYFLKRFSALKIPRQEIMQKIVSPALKV